MFKKPQNLKGLTVNFVVGLFKTMFLRSNFFAFFVGRILWIAFTFYGINFNTESCLLTARQHTSYNNHKQEIFNLLPLSFSERKWKTASWGK